MSDLLVQRLKAAKKELTALKTAHKRGLGLLRIYTEDGEIPDIGSGFWIITATITFTEGSAPFPFAYIETGLSETGVDDEQLDVTQTYYSNDGMSLIVKMLWIKFSEDKARYRVVSTAPFSISLTWEQS